MNDLDKISFGQALKEARISAGYTQNDLAKMLGVTTAAVSLWESGMNIPHSRSQLAIEMIFNLKYFDQIPLVYEKKHSDVIKMIVPIIEKLDKDDCALLVRFAKDLVFYHRHRSRDTNGS